jgi:hypothetical protein
MFNKKIILLIAFFFALPALSQTTDEIVGKTLKSTGYSENIKKISTMAITCKGKMNGLDFTLSLWYKKPHFAKTEMQINNQKTITCYNDIDGWYTAPFKGKFKPVKMTQEQFDIESSPLNEFFFLPLHEYKKRGFNVDFTGLEKIGRKLCYALKIVSAKGDSAYWYIDPENHLPYASKVIRRKSSDSKNVIVFYGEYKPVMGILFPHLYLTSPDSKQPLNYKWEKVDLNIPLKDDFFRIPSN